MNPIYSQYYSHEGCDYYKIDLPFTNYHSETIVLCPVDKGYEIAKTMAIGVINEHLAEVMAQEPITTKEDNVTKKEKLKRAMLKTGKAYDTALKHAGKANKAKDVAGNAYYIARAAYNDAWKAYTECK